jgi:hypothetical protein
MRSITAELRALSINHYWEKETHMVTTGKKIDITRQAQSVQSSICSAAGTEDIFECGVCFFQSNAHDFTPVSASADFDVLECPNCLNNDMDSFQLVTQEYKHAA